jgi:hypothetical protein
VSLKRTPEEILFVFDQAQERLDGIEPEVFDMRVLVWEVIEDLLDSLGRYDTWEFESDAPRDVVRACKDMLTDYVVNNYGDD